MKSHIRRHAGAGLTNQKGVALIVSLVLLVVVTLLGLTSMRGTALQERMSANMYDRSLALQRSEGALRAAEAAITANWQIADLSGVDCSVATGGACPLVPATTFINDNTNWVNVSAAHEMNAISTPGTPQYTVQFLASGPAEGNFGVDANADYASYGSPYPPDEVAYYRVTTRSSNPSDAAGRAIAVLQSTYKRAF
jgi:type IV pilus assembly protein PilX